MAPLSAATKTFKVQYGSFILDETNSIALQARNRRYTLRETHQDGYFAVDFVLRLATQTGNEATDDAAFQTLVNATETALRKRRLKLTVTLGGNVINGNGAGWDPATNVKTAFLIEAECEKIGGPGDSGRRRTYRFSVRCQFPADQVDFHRDSATQTVQGVNGRRICIIRSLFTASPGQSAYDNWNTNGHTLEASKLPTPVTSGEWVLNTENPIYDDETATLQTTAVYWEVVNGLREYDVDIVYRANQGRVVTIGGLYMTTTGATARVNYNTNVTTFAQAILDAEGGHALYESVSIPKTIKVDTTGKLCRFQHTYTEITFPQGPSANDDPRITTSSIEIASLSMFDRQTITKTNLVTRLRRAKINYTAILDRTVASYSDLWALWDSTFRAYVTRSCAQYLGSLTLVVEVEDVKLGLTENGFTAVLDLLVRGGDILSLAMREKIHRTPALNPWPVAESPHVYWPYKEPPTKILERVAIVEHVVGLPKPTIWGPGPEGSGFKFTDTIKTAEEVLDALEQGNLPSAPGWVIFKPGLAEEYFPGSRGSDDSFATVIYVRTETWLYVAKWATQRIATGQAASGSNSAGLMTVSK